MSAARRLEAAPVELLGVVVIALAEESEEARRVDLADVAGRSGEHLASPTQRSLE